MLPGEVTWCSLNIHIAIDLDGRKLVWPQLSPHEEILSLESLRNRKEATMAGVEWGWPGARWGWRVSRSHSIKAAATEEPYVEEGGTPPTPGRDPPPHHRIPASPCCPHSTERRADRSHQDISIQALSAVLAITRAEIEPRFSSHG